MATERAVKSPESKNYPPEGVLNEGTLKTSPSPVAGRASEVSQNNRIEEIEEDEDSPFGVWSEDDAEDMPFRVLLYGQTGSGKTWYAATFPKPLFLDLEQGLRTTFQVGPVLRYPKNPNRIIKSLNQVYDFYDLVKSEKNPKFETVVIDSLNELQLLAIKAVLSEYGNVSRQMEDQLTLQDYGKVNRIVLDIVRDFLNLPYHIVFTAVETDREYEDQQVRPSFTGRGIWKELKRWMEMIGYCTTQRGENGEEYVVSYKLTPKWVAKDRLGIQEKYLPNDFSALLQYASE